MLLTAIMVSAVFSVALSSKKSGAKSERRLVAAQASRELSGVLKNFVTGDPNDSIIGGPGGVIWTMDGAFSGPPASDDTSCVNCYALSPGSHTITGFLPGWFEAAPYNATLTYFVAYSQAYSVANGTVPWVNVTIDWQEP